MTEIPRDNEETNTTNPVGKTENFVSKHFVRLLVWLAVSGGALAIFGPWLLYVAGCTGETDANLRLHILYVTGGTIAVLGLVETHRKNTTDRIKADADIQNYQASQSHQAKMLDEQARQFTENIAKEREKIEADKAKNEQDHIRQVHAERRSRYTTAIEQLSNDKASIRLGGVYTLVGLVDEWLADEKTIPNIEERRKEGQVIINNLCAYIRSSFDLVSKIKELSESTDTPKGYSGGIQQFIKDQARFREEKELRTTILDEIRTRLNGGAITQEDETRKLLKGPWSNFDYDFSNTVFFYPVSFNNSYFGASPNFSGAEFTENADFSWAKFSQTKFTRDADFSWANFIGIPDFFGADFSGAKFTENADFSGAKFTWFANFSGTEFTENAYFFRAEFTWFANFSGADFSKAKFFWSANFSEAKFTQAKFTEAEFTENADFSEAKFFWSAQFFGTKFTKDADFSEAKFPSVEFTQAKFTENADFSKASFIDTADFSEAKFTEAKFTEAEFPENADFSEAKFTEADFSLVKFTEADFSWAKFTEADFSWAKFAGNSDFSGVTFTQSADFSGVTFEGEPIFEYMVNNKARFSYKANPENYNFNVSSKSPYKIETEEQKHNGVKFIVPKGTELFDPDDPSS